MNKILIGLGLLLATPAFAATTPATSGTTAPAPVAKSHNAKKTVAEPAPAGEAKPEAKPEKKAKKSSKKDGAKTDKAPEAAPAK